METPDLIGSLHDTNDPDLAIPNVPTSHELPANSQHTASFLCDLVDKIVLSAEARQAIKETSNERFDGIDRSDDATESPISEVTDNVGGPLNQDEIEHLSVACAGNSNDQRGFTMSSWEAVDGDSLSSLIPMLETHVNSAAALDLVTAAFSVSHETDAFDEYINENFPKSMTVLKLGLQSASIILSILVCPNVDRARVPSEDAIEFCISLLRQHLVKHMIPSFTNGAGFTAGDKGLKNKSVLKKNKHTNSGTGKKARSKSLKSSTIMYGCIFKPILSTVMPTVLLMEQFELLIRTIQLDDRPIISISSSALSTISVDPHAGGVGLSSENKHLSASLCHLIQMSGLNIVTCIFQRYSRHRGIILEDLFPLMLKLPTGKKSLRTYPLRSIISEGTVTSSNIQLITALILNLVHSCVVMPCSAPVSKETPSTNGTASASPKTPVKEKEDNCKESYLTSGLSGCASVCTAIVAQILQRCSRRSSDGASEFRPILFNLVEDLLAVQLHPEYPGSETFLSSLCRGLTNDLLRCTSGGSGNTPSKNGTSSLEPTYIATAMDVLGKIASSTAYQLRVHKENPFDPLGKSTQVSESAAAAPINDEGEKNKCFCGRERLVDTFMLDCDNCHSWFHGSCIGITKDNLPSVWMCDECKLRIEVMEQTRSFRQRWNRKTGKENPEDSVAPDEIRSSEKAPPQDRKESKKKAKHKRKNSSSTEIDCETKISASIDESFILRQLLLNYVSNSDCAALSGIAIAREFHLAKWIQNYNHQWCHGTSNDQRLSAELMCQHFLQQWDVSSLYDFGDVTCQTRRQLSEQGNFKVTRALVARTSQLCLAFPNLLGVLLKLMGDKNMVSFRKLAVKAIDQVIKSDSSLMVHPVVCRAVSRCFTDTSISVRDAAVSLVGSYVLQTPAIADIFHNSLVLRLDDVGVSVRRRTVKIFQEILHTQQQYKKSCRAEVCTKMLLRAANPKEEDGVRDLIHETFHTLWFEDPAQHQGIHCISSSATDASNATSLTTETSLQTNKSCLQQNQALNGTDVAKPHCQSIAIQMVEVVEISGGSIDALSKLVKELLFGFGEGDKDSKLKERKKRRVVVESHCINIVNAIFEELLAFEDIRSLGQGDANSVTQAKRLVALISTAGVFCEASPQTVLHHLDTLLPYLKGDNHVSNTDESIILKVVCQMMTKMASLLTESDIQRLCQNKIADDLCNIAYKFGIVASGAAVEALSSLSRQYNSEANIKTFPAREKLLKLSTIFYGYLLKVKDTSDDFSGSKSGVKNNVQRALTVLGAVCRHRDKEIETSDVAISCGEQFDPNSDINLIDPHSLTWLNLSDSCFDVFVFFLCKKDPSTKCAALRACSGIFIARPRIMLAAERSGIIAQVMSDQSHPQVQHEALRCWCEILMSEEKRLESGEAKKKMEKNQEISLSKKISGDQDSDASLVGSVLNQHSTRLFQLTSSVHPKIRLVTLDLIGILLRQGLINPMETVPFLLALQGDVDVPAVRNLALNLLIMEGDKRPDMLRQRVRAGVRQAFTFQRIINKEKNVITAIVDSESENRDVECIFSAIYKRSLSTSKVQKQGLFRSLLSLFASAGIEGSEDGDTCTNEVLNSLQKLHSPISKVKPKGKKPCYSKQLPMLSYASQILAHLPYDSSTDPLFIIYHISGLTSLNGAQLLDRFTSFLRPYGVSDEDGNDDNTNEDKMELVAKEKNPNDSTSLSFMDDENFDLSKFKDLCAQASAITLTLRLSQFLKRVFALDEVKCMEYIPTEKEKISDKHISLPDKMPLFNNHVEGHGSCDQNSKVESQNCSVKIKFSLIKQYAEFRRMMRIASEVDSGRVLNQPDENKNEARLKRRSGFRGMKKGSRGRGRPKSSKKRKKGDDWNSDADDSDVDDFDLMDADY
eukprot:CAMPEP_0194364154 /NCGR_PEP_ID=MMETSP0174-20130528/12062_1 /TAXON_ID=216777 /ORGANISM="Proboscia alata, Strain PI-D3" /LENGTH=1887 /DNA_ID=CAMNT_0039138029 /DNA_START=35 /DNA_END=5698 /DNA_ORIENTATION=-